MSTDKYFATAPDAEAVQECLKLESRYRAACEAKGLRKTWSLTYAQKFGLDPMYVSAGAGVIAEGDVDGIQNLRFRTNLVKVYSRQAVLLAMGERVGYQVVATNLDVESQAQVGLIGRMLDYVTTEAGVDQVVYSAAESNQAYGAGGIHVSWDRSKGDPVPTLEAATDPETNEPIMVEDESGNPVPFMKSVKRPSGSITLKRFYPWQIVKDVLLEDPNWIILLEPVSRHELVAMFPALAEQIGGLPKANATDFYELFGFATTFVTDDVVILRHFYHRNCLSVPGGRYLGYVDSLPLWSRRCPVQNGLPYTEVRTMPYDGTGIGHPEAADMSAQQEVFDDLLSAVTTNLVRYKDQPLYVDERIKYDGDKNVYVLPDGVEAPKTAQYQQVPEASKYMLELLPQLMKNTAGLNDAAMGQPQGANMSGVAIVSLVQTAIKLQRATQLAIDVAYTDIGNIALELIKANASNGLVAEIAGNTDESLTHFFTQQSLESARRAKVIRSNPMLGTFAGKLELWNAIKDKPKDERRAVIEMMTTNSFEAVLGDDQTCTDVIRWENAELSAGRDVTVGVTDDPKLHVPAHRGQLDKIRMMPDGPAKDAAIGAFARHLKGHSEAWMSMDPLTAEALGIPLPSVRQQMLSAPPAPLYARPPDPLPPEMSRGAAVPSILYERR